MKIPAVDTSTGPYVTPNYPASSVAGDSLTPVTIGSTEVLQMPKRAIGVYNSGAATITLSLIPANNDETNIVTVDVVSKTSLRLCKFNAVATSGSTGHDAATTHYFLG